MTSDERVSSRTVQGADTVVLAGSDDARARLAAQVGGNVGRYVVIAEIGRGGMGRVLRAYDPKLQREVALKEVRSRLLGPIGARRLVAEARAMAKLAHPNVVAVYDVEELAHDQVVVVMEYVAGRTLTKWVAGRTWQEIIACFRRAGRGLAAAHAVGLLHRDFKPDNVLIADDGAVKVTDFGLAKLADEEGVALPHSGDEDGLTATGVVLGTPRFMAPEQHRGEQLGPAADQYAFCVALWYALTDAAPFDRHGLEALERAKSKGPPAWPGGPTPRAIVDAIVRGLAPDPARRWPSIDALLDALAFDPAQRRRRRLRTAAAIAVVGAAAFGVQRWASTRAQQCTEADAVARLEGAWDEPRRIAVRDALLGAGPAYAEGVWTRAEQTLDAYAQAWAAMHVDACAATTIRGEQSTAVMDLRMGCLHRAKLELAAITNVLARADTQTLQRAHELLQSLRPLPRCADVAGLQLDVEPPLPEQAEAVDTVRRLIADAKAQRRAGKVDEEAQSLAAARAAIADVDYPAAHVEIAIEAGNQLDIAGDYAGAEAVLRDALTISARQRYWGGVQDAAMMLLYVVGSRQHRVEEGLTYFDLALGLAAGDPERESGAYSNLAGVLIAEGKFAEAETYARRAIEIWDRSGVSTDNANYADGMGLIANAVANQGDLPAAEQIYRRALAAQERVLGPDHPSTATMHANIAATLFMQGKPEEGEAELRPALQRMEAALGPTHPQVLMVAQNLAASLTLRGAYADAEVELREVLSRWEQTTGPESPEAAAARANLAVALQHQHKLDEAEAELRHALATREKVLAADHPDIAKTRKLLAELAAEQPATRRR